jgi:hypothetical protein
MHLVRPRTPRLEAAGDDGVQDGPADQPGAPARPDDGDRGRGQHVPRAGHVGRSFPFGDRIPVGVEAGVPLGGRKRLAAS